MAAELIEAGVDVPRRLPPPLRGHAAGQARAARARARPDPALRRRRARRWRRSAPRTSTRAEAEESYSEGIIDQLRALQGTKVAVLVRELSQRRAQGPAQSLAARDRRRRRRVGDRARPGRRRPPPRRRLLDDARARRADRVPARGDRRAAARLLRRARRRHARLSAAQPTAPARPMDGVLLIDKPAGMTSHDVVAAVRRSLGGRADRPRRHARPVRDRPAARARRPGDQGPARADGAAQAL